MVILVMDLSEGSAYGQAAEDWVQHLKEHRWDAILTVLRRLSCGW